ncbi:M23 family metallopeptidase [uncultured Serinicoccus sp.]|uniref:M23 family metallopeptidase n=1 Tax=uncultured Serinicoccus sp. TaxID=735514 RepID=UPI00261B40A5|nr:M23 family metallopeptidase [uncultured Serinicoccus sp.]
MNRTRGPVQADRSGRAGRSGRSGRSGLAALAAVVVLSGSAAPEAATTPRLSSPGALASVLLGLRVPAVDAAQGDRHSTALWGWPLAGAPEIVRGFDPPEERWGSGHRGLDLAGLVGERVLAVDEGVVSFSGEVAGVGVVSVTHASGLRSTYQPVGDRVARGVRVARGDPLGRVTSGGHCPVHDCLHLGAVRGRDGYVDPTPLLLGVQLTLLPHEGWATGRTGAGPTAGGGGGTREEG